MPEFEFVCLLCGNQFNIEHHMGETVTTPDCPRCGSFDTMRVYPIPVFHLHGHGFYKTDYPQHGDWGDDA